ncbi:MAG: RNA-binding protein [Roseburia sp.]
MNEQELCKKRLLDLSKQANRKGIVLFSDFLNLNELNIYHQTKNQLESQTETFGGMELSERQMVAFLPDALYYEWDYPITCLKIVPSYPKFAEKLTHRDVLGSIMNLGVERSKLGDIVMNENAYYLFCEESIAPYFLEHLEKIRHTLVKISVVEASEVAFGQKYQEKSGIITSNRIDSVIACVYKLSRSKASELIRAEKVFVNGKAILCNTYCCKGQDIISVRGMGRFVYEGECGETQKGRLRIQYKLYE